MIDNQPLYADILLPLALPDPFTYRVPAELSVRMQVGMRAVVPLGKTRILAGLIWRIHSDPPPHPVRDILSIPDDAPVIDQKQPGFWEWMAGYYLCTTGEVMKAALPAFLRNPDKTFGWEKERELREGREGREGREEREEGEDLGESEAYVVQDFTQGHFTNPSLEAGDKRQPGDSLQPEAGNREPANVNLNLLTDSQQQVLQSICQNVGKKPVHLLHGVASSGKTEIYIHLIDRYLSQGFQVLYLLPEIALTTQIINRLEKVFGNRLLVYHSRFTPARRLKIWNQVLSGPAAGGQLVLGVRSSVFLPFRNLGLIIVDEEHEHSYKQQDPAPRYHARDTAIILGQAHEAPVLLGTATPSLESWHQAHSGKYQLYVINERFGTAEPPEIILADTRDARKRKQMRGSFTPLLLDAIGETLKAGEQTILFQNRRGYSPYIQCQDCQWIPKCRHCDVSMTLHRGKNRLECHYCGFSSRIPAACPECGSTGLSMRGLGTERIEDDLQIIFPEARLARLDLDSTRAAAAYGRILGDFESGAIDILIGTQMISKGLDFSRVNLVGIIDADQLLNYPDFRSFERSFQLMTQVSGRAGRRDKKGLVIIQCSDPQHPVLRQVADYDLPGFYRSELSERQQFGYPPYTRLINITLKHSDAGQAAEAASELAAELRRNPGKRVMGPQIPLVGRIQNKYLQSILIKLERNPELINRKNEIASQIKKLEDNKAFGNLIIQADVDPL